jgi:ectoine hydroxylase-related dioxygenase (phytanoyl-CoA dioxygenase family)
MEQNEVRQQLQTQGYIVVRDLLSEAEVQFYNRKLETLSGISRRNFRGKVSGRGGHISWNRPDGVSKTPDFWPVIFHERLLTTIKALLGPEVRYLQHSDLHVGFSAVSWHRDNVNRTFGHGPDWDESVQPYQLLRVGIYLQSFAESNFRLGFIAGSHRPTPYVSLARKLTEAKLQSLGTLSYLSAKFQMWAAQAQWVATEPGDCIIFDPRTLHSGSYITGPKYSLFVAYGRENEHFYNHHNYYRHLRSELNYGDLAPELIQLLKDADLYQEQVPVYDRIQGAWTPAPILKNYLAQRFK